MAGSGVRRVFIEDERGDGNFLRMTWHPDRESFVVSNWNGPLCVGATRVPVQAAPRLISLLVDGLSDASTRPPPAALRSPRLTLVEHVRVWWRDRTATAAVHELREELGDHRRRSA